MTTTTTILQAGTRVEFPRAQRDLLNLDQDTPWNLEKDIPAGTTGTVEAARLIQGRMVYTVRQDRNGRRLAVPGFMIQEVPR